MATPIKAKLLSIDTGYHIEFMFNPNQLDFSRSISLEQSPGARTEEGMNKTSFKHPNPYTLTISNILIDRYESGETVIKDIEAFKKSVEFGVEIDGVKRPPLYLFTWGGQNYLKCFVKTLKYKLTMFNANGLPVRAFVDLTLEEIDLSSKKGPGGTPNPTPDQKKQDNRNSRTN
ncbi:hypothetical protein FJR38_11065 [Anabaena sp. UHCC 0253]|uniref:CIS tube protein n=1 Tax=Anabaena sp. UHCC 0253 TaxID=2590019 RepID=UPI0014486FEC|nr:hypothetical protein [Anabaena sp. UHCC 0253]MTJ53141.1 hypothetical protein [Anabaena sp. UHCC 0253]